jgi:hypothetical protein
LLPSIGFGDVVSTAIESNARDRPRIGERGDSREPDTAKKKERELRRYVDRVKTAATV